MNSDPADNREIIRLKKRRLQALHLQAARYGINTPPEISLEIEDLEKEIKQLEGSAPAPVPVPVSPQPTPQQQGRRWQPTGAQKRELVTALLACPAISDQGTRDALLRQLPQAITSRINYNSSSNIHVLNIIDACLSYSGGMEELIGALRFLEGNSLQMQDLDAVLVRVLPGFSVS